MIYLKVRRVNDEPHKEMAECRQVAFVATKGLSYFSV